MKKLFGFFTFYFLFFTFQFATAQNVGIGTTTPNPSAQLDLSSTNKGFLPPRLTGAQRDAIQNPATGLIIYCTNCGENPEMQYYDGSAWRSMMKGVGSDLLTTVTDIDGNIYPIVKINNQTWMAQNLTVTRYRNGDVIPEVKDPSQWASLSTGAWCHYENKTENGVIYGKLYNFYAVIDPRGLAPEGWHIPSDVEWTDLTDALGGSLVAGGKMKTTGTLEQTTGLWKSPNAFANNSSGFSALPGGGRNYDGQSFQLMGSNGAWWSSNAVSSYWAWFRSLDYNSGEVNRDNFYHQYGLSIRCVKD